MYEIKPFDNTEKVYESISGHTVENWSSETLALNDSLNFPKFDAFHIQKLSDMAKFS